MQQQDILQNLDDYLADYDAWNDGKSYVEATKAATYYDGSYYADGWQKINGVWYYFDSQGIWL